MKIKKYLVIDKMQLALLLLGFTSGLPLFLTTSTLAMRLDQQYHMPIYVISLFSLATLPKILGFLIAPMLDMVSIAWLNGRLGFRRSWMIVLQILLIVFILLCAVVDLSYNVVITTGIIAVICLLGTMQDIVIQAYQRERLLNNQYGKFEAIYILGYRIGMMMSGAGALYLASIYDWQAAYIIIAGLMVVGILIILMLPEVKYTTDRKPVKPMEHLSQLWPSLKSLTVGLPLCLFILFTYKIGDHIIGNMSGLFFSQLGFSNIVIANTHKILGTFAAILGGFIGARIIKKRQPLHSLMPCLLLHILSSTTYIWLSYANNPSIYEFGIVVFLENLTSGMRTIALLSFQLSLCDEKFPATKIAMMGSAVHGARALFSSTSGFIVDAWGWHNLFILATVSYVIPLVAIWYYLSIYPSTQLSSSYQN